MGASPAIPPPPAPEDVTPDLGPASEGSGSAMDKFRAIITHLSGGGTPAIQERLAADFAKRQHDAELYRTNAKTAATYLTHANATKSAQAPMGVNPVTGAPATAQDIQQWQNNLDTSQQAYLKLLPKDAKSIAQKLGEVVEHTIGRKGASGSPAGQGAAPAIQPPPQGQPTASAASAGPAVPPPPSAGAGAAQNPMELPASISPLTLGAGETQRMTGVQNALAQKQAEESQRAAAPILAKQQGELAEPEVIKRQLDAIRGLPEDERRAAMVRLGMIPSKLVGKGLTPDIKNGRLMGVKDAISGEYYTDPDKMPEDARAIWDRAQSEIGQKVQLGLDKERREFSRRLTLQSSSLQNSLARGDYTAARGIVRDARKDYDGAIDRMKTMDQNLQSALKGDQQAMVSLVANHIGMTLGMQKGARITRAVWEEAMQSAPELGRVQSKFDDRGYLAGVTLTPEQMHQMVDLAHEKTEILHEHIGRVGEEYRNDLVTRRTGMTPPPASASSSQYVYARDPQGKLHRAPQGTKLPQGWKQENAPVQ